MPAPKSAPTWDAPRGGDLNDEIRCPITPACASRRALRLGGRASCLGEGGDQTPEFIRASLLNVWGEQACQHQKDWPEVLARLMAPTTSSQNSSPNNHGRAGQRPWVDHAVTELTAAFANGPPADPTDAVWRAFPKLDREHCAQLAVLLSDAAHREAA